MNNINEDSEQALVEVSEHQIGDDPQYVDVEIDAQKADEAKENKFIGFLPNLRKRLVEYC